MEKKMVKYLAMLSGGVLLFSGCKGKEAPPLTTSTALEIAEAVNVPITESMPSQEEGQEIVMLSKDSALFLESNENELLAPFASPTMEFANVPITEIALSQTMKQETILDHLALNRIEPTSQNSIEAGDWGAIAFFGEAAPRNFRGNATYGIYFTPMQRFKITGEYLTQKLDFDFDFKNGTKWASQIAVGSIFQYLIDNSCFQSFELGTAFNHAFNHDLGSKTTPVGTFKHRIAGSNALLSFAGTTMGLWNCAFFSAELNYDWVKFRRIYEAHKISNGFGVSMGFMQQFARDFSLNLSADFRQPFNALQGLLNWNHRFSSFNFGLGVFGNLTYGNDHVRTIRTVGVQLGFSLGTKTGSCGRDFEMSSHRKKCYAREFCDSSQWVGTPATHVPIVLAIPDELKVKDPNQTTPAKVSLRADKAAKVVLPNAQPVFKSASI